MDLSFSNDALLLATTTMLAGLLPHFKKEIRLIVEKYISYRVFFIIAMFTSLFFLTMGFFSSSNISLTAKETSTFRKIKLTYYLDNFSNKSCRVKLSKLCHDSFYEREHIIKSDAYSQILICGKEYNFIVKHVKNNSCVIGVD